MELSLIIANYNNGQYLDYCLNSVVNQTYWPFELIIVDGGSTDNSMDIISKYQSIYGSIKCYVLEKKGVSNARHYGILMSNGKYITTLDSDDYFLDEKKLETEIDLMHEKKQNGLNPIAYSNFTRVYNTNKNSYVVFNSKNILNGNVLYKILTRSKPIPRDFIMEKDLYFSIGGYDISLPIYEDWDLKIRLASKCGFYFSGLNGIAYRQHDEGLSSASPMVHFKYMFKVFSKNVHLLPFYQIIPSCIQFFIFRMLFVLKANMLMVSKKIGIYQFIVSIYNKVK